MGSAAPSPAERYAAELASGAMVPDPAQARAVDALQQVYDGLCASKPPRRGLLRRRRSGWSAVKGLYLWGGVGRGKTLLMDHFFESLPMAEKRRTHFHRFMLDVHARRRNYLEEQDPVALIAEAIAEETRVLCFDEFFVSDIADAMILGRLTEVLFRQGVTLVATSNVAPQGLYRDGLQRERFVPAIERIEQHCTVLELASDTDHRLRTLEQEALYLHPCDDAGRSALAAHFDRLSHGQRAVPKDLSVNGRTLRAQAAWDDIVWFSFAELCESARAAADYIALAREFQTVLIGDLPRLDGSMEDAARRFVHLVDEFYDRGVKLVVNADAPITELYCGQRVRFEFERTVSRLIEMQSRHYLSLPHKPL